MLGDQINHLAADHAGRPSGRGEFGDELAPHRWVTVRIGIGQHPEGGRQQTVSGEHRRCFVELLVAGRAAAPQFAVVHRRQIVVHERIGMDHLDCRSDLQGATPRNPEQTRAGEHKKRAQPLAWCQRRIAHRVIDPRLEIGRHDEQLIERDIGQLRRLRQRLGK